MTGTSWPEPICPANTRHSTDVRWMLGYRRVDIKRT